MFTGLSLLCWIVGLTVLYGSYKVAVWIAETPTVEDAPLSRLDRLDGRVDDVDVMELFARDRGAR